MPPSLLDLDAVQDLLGHRPLLQLPLFGRVDAAVLIPVQEQAGQHCLLLTKRASTLDDHPGELSFPGGRRDPGDADLQATALREAHEEIGLHPDDVQVLGRLDDFASNSGYRIAVFVGLIPPQFQAVPKEDEVAGVLAIPVSVLRAACLGPSVTLCRRGFPETFPVFRHQGDLVWGITARIIKDLLTALTPADQLSEEDLLEATYRQAAARLLAAKKVALCTHMNPDGDGLGCEAALYHALTDLGAKVQIANADHTPPRFQFLFERIPKEAFVEPTENLGRHCDCFLVVDTGEWKRIARAEGAAKAAGPRLLVLDHHLSGDMTCEGSLMLARSWYSCTGEMVSRLLSTMGLPMTETYASPLLASIMYDTGGFRFVGQRNEPFETASYLVRSGARTADMQEAIFASITRQRLDATTRILASLTYEEGGQFVWAWVDNKLAEETGADRDDIGETISTMIALSDVKIAALIKEEHRDRVKVSLRSKACCPVSSVAQALGGGGHAHACGAVIKGSREGILEQLRILVREALANSK